MHNNRHPHSLLRTEEQEVPAQALGAANRELNKNNKYWYMLAALLLLLAFSLILYVS